MAQIDVDVKRMIFPGEYLYAHSIYGEQKRTIFPLSEGRFWVIETLPMCLNDTCLAQSLVVGSIYEVRPRGLYTSPAKVLDSPTAAPPTHDEATEFTLVVPSRFREGESIVVLHHEDEEGCLNGELCPSLVKLADQAFIVIKIKTSNGMEVEEWWQQDVGMVKRLFIAPPLGETELRSVTPLAPQ